MVDNSRVEKAAEEFCIKYKRLHDEIGKAIVGHSEIVGGVLTCLFVGGHALLEGVPGLGKTYLIRTLSQALSLAFNRIQFTPDLMPADIIGTDIVMDDPETGRREFTFQHGPVFAQMILADEINRATPKTQSALLEAMQEHQVTVGGKRYKLEEPFFVMATQNPIEQEGTYPLPEAQLDRFFFKLIVQPSGRADLIEILNRTTSGRSAEINPVMNKDEIIGSQKLVQRVVIAPHVQDYVVRLVLATSPNTEFSTPMVNRFVRWGSSPRGAQAVTLSAKVRSLLDGRFNVSFDDIKAVAKPALRHRMLLNFEGEAENISTDGVVDDLLKLIPTVGEKAA